MIPITPASASVRLASFAEEEWEDKLAPIIDDVENGWSGILRLNQALFDPESSYDFFASDSFNYLTDLDNGQSRTWSLAFAAAAINTR